MILGAHVRTVGGLQNAFIMAEELSCEAIQIFTRSPQRWTTKPIERKAIDLFKRAWAQSAVVEILAHDCYLTNLATDDQTILAKSITSFADQMNRCELLGVGYLVTHLGSHKGIGERKGMSNFVRNIETAIAESDASNVRILLETTAGQGTNLGYTFEQIRFVLDHVTDPDRFGVLYDTCHTFAAGYDLTTPEAYDRTWDEFDRIIGLDLLQAFHLNDSKSELGSRRDRHENIGEGVIGVETFRMLLNDDRFADLPGILETPDDRFDENLKLLRSLIES